MCESPVFYILINSDLQMSKGQINAQIVHITQLIVEECVKMSYETIKISEEIVNYMKWKKNPKCVILKASNEELLKLLNHKYCRRFYDSGNRIKDESLTIIGFLPSSDLNELFTDFKLY
jgi:peptidyl-tRNA hydrolase